MDFYKIFAVTNFDEISDRLESIKDSEHSPSPAPVDKYIAEITYCLRSDGGVDIKTTWVPAEQNINLFAALLHVVSSTGLRRELSKLMVELSEHPEHTEYLEAVLAKWQKFASSAKEIPVIRPLNALKLSKDTMGGEE